MLTRLTIKNYRCFNDFSCDFAQLNSCVILGRNGAGKSTIGRVLEILQKIAHSTSRVGSLVKLSDISDQLAGPIEFVVEATISNRNYRYKISFELPERFKEMRVLNEELSSDGSVIFTRQTSQISLKRSSQVSETTFGVDWHVTALPIIQTLSSSDPIAVFKRWLANIIVIRPVPSLMNGDSEGETLNPKSNAENIGEWWTGVLAANPSSYEPLIKFLQQVMPDIFAVKNPNIGSDNRSLSAEFKEEDSSITLQFGTLSDGEKCFFVCAILIAMCAEKQAFTCFWDEPDNYLAPQEISHTMIALRRAFMGQNQIILTSHNAEAIRCFSDENTIILSRTSRLTSPTASTLAKFRDDNKVGGSTLELWLRGDL